MSVEEVLKLGGVTLQGDIDWQCRLNAHVNRRSREQ